MEPGRELADPPGTWREHWFDHRQLLRLYRSDGHCAIYTDPGVRLAEVRWLPRFINVTWQYSKAAYGEAFGPRTPCDRRQGPRRGSVTMTATVPTAGTAFSVCLPLSRAHSWDHGTAPCRCC